MGDSVTNPQEVRQVVSDQEEITSVPMGETSVIPEVDEAARGTRPTSFFDQVRTNDDFDPVLDTVNPVTASVPNEPVPERVKVGIKVMKPFQVPSIGPRTDTQIAVDEGTKLENDGFGVYYSDKDVSIGGFFSKGEAPNITIDLGELDKGNKIVISPRFIIEKGKDGEEDKVKENENREWILKNTDIPLYRNIYWKEPLKAGTPIKSGEPLFVLGKDRQKIAEFRFHIVANTLVCGYKRYETPKKDPEEWVKEVLNSKK